MLAAGHPADPHALIVTGISRSGTSYLSNLLHRFENCVAVNEPREMVAELRRGGAPWGVALFYRDTRRAIRAGAAIENKLRDGEVVDDTARYQVRHAYTPAVAGGDFVLAVKNTREFLCRLDAVRLVMPTARVVACVRNPVDTIASWKGSFPHLRDPDIRSFLGDPKRPWLPEGQRSALESIAAVGDPAERRARFWQFLAQRLLDNRDGLLLVRYDDLVSRPTAVLERVLDGYRAGGLRRPITPAMPRQRRELLDPDDWRAIEAHCSRTAAELGIEMPEKP